MPRHDDVPEVSAPWEPRLYGPCAHPSLADRESLQVQEAAGHALAGASFGLSPGMDKASRFAGRGLTTEQ